MPRPRQLLMNNAAWLTICRAVADIAGFVLFALLSRIYGPAVTGEYSYSFAIGTLVGLVATAGMEEFGIRAFVRAAHNQARVWSNLLSTQVAQSTATLLGLAVFMAISHTRLASSLLVLELALFQLAAALAHTLFVPAMAARNMVKPALQELACRVGGIALVLIILAIGPPQPTIALLPLPAAGLVLLLLAFKNSRHHAAFQRLNLSWSVWKDTWRQTSHFAGAQTLSQFYVRTDLLMIAYFLGNEPIGIYATDIKFVEVGLVPLALLGTASHPVLSTLLSSPAATRSAAVREFCGLEIMLSGWLTAGISLLLPCLIVPLFGIQFAPAVALLPWFAALAFVKGVEVALSRLAYSFNRQSLYLHSLLAGISVLAVLNLLWIPRYGLVGAILAALCGTTCVVIVCGVGMRRHVAGYAFVELIMRAVAALLMTFAVVEVALAPRLAPWLAATLGCALYPAFSALAGLLPNPVRSILFAGGPPGHLHFGERK